MAYTWNEILPSGYLSVDCSSTGEKVLLGPYYNVSPNYPTRSVDYGQNFTSLAGKANIGSGTYSSYGVASSDDGTKLIIARNGNGFITSSDSGNTWAETDIGGSYDVPAVASSADGLTTYAAVKNFYSFKNVNLFTTVGALAWSGVACSADGNTVYLTVDGGHVYRSTNAASSWTDLSTLGDLAWDGIACSDDGTKVIAWVNGGNVYVSTDSATTLTAVSSLGTGTWSSGDISSDGSTLVVSKSSGYIYISEDGGTTWDEQLSPGTNVWDNIRISKDKSYIFAVNNNAPGWIGSLSPGFTITSITPTTGSTSGGTPVTITGTGFDPAATAAIDGNDLTDLTVVDPTTITGVTPAGTVGAKDVVVTNP